MENCPATDCTIDVIECQTANCNITVIPNCNTTTCDIEIVDKYYTDCSVEISGGCKDVLVKSCKLDDCQLCCDPHKSGFFWNNWCTQDGAQLVASGGSFALDKFDPVLSAVNACDCSFNQSWKFRSNATYKITVPDPQQVDAVVIWGHNLSGNLAVMGNGGVVLQPENWSMPYASSDISEDDAPLIVYLDGSEHSEVTLVFTSDNDDIVCIENIFIGECLDIPEGLRQFANPFNGSEYKSKYKSSACGPLGRSLERVAVDLDITLEGLCLDWLREKWRPFVCYLQSGVVYFAWSKNRYPDELARAWLDGSIEPSEFEDAFFSTVTVSLKAQLGHGEKAK